MKMQMMTISLNSTFLISENTLFFCLNLMNFFFCPAFILCSKGIHYSNLWDIHIEWNFTLNLTLGSAIYWSQNGFCHVSHVCTYAECTESLKMCRYISCLVTLKISAFWLYELWTKRNLSSEFYRVKVHRPFLGPLGYTCMSTTCI